MGACATDREFIDELQMNSLNVKVFIIEKRE